MQTHTCITPKGDFIYGIHKPTYRVTNLRSSETISSLGCDDKNQEIDNRINYPSGHISIENAGWVYEIPNALFFKGRTYINKSWADKTAENPLSISLPSQRQTSLTKLLLDNSVTQKKCSDIFSSMPAPIKLALATASTDPDDLELLARNSCELVFEKDTGRPRGLKFCSTETGEKTPVIFDHTIFDSVANNINLSDDYKEAMVLRPGAQGTSEIVGEWHDENEGNSPTHVFEYLRKTATSLGGIMLPTWLMTLCVTRWLIFQLRILQGCAIFIISAPTSALLKI